MLPADLHAPRHLPGGVVGQTQPRVRSLTKQLINNLNWL